MSAKNAESLTERLDQWAYDTGYDSPGSRGRLRRSLIASSGPLSDPSIVAQLPGAKPLLDVVRAALAHRPVTENCYPYDCYAGNCEHDECAEMEVVVCAACYALNYEIDDECLRDEALAENCVVCRSVEALPPAVRDLIEGGET